MHPRLEPAPGWLRHFEVHGYIDRTILLYCKTCLEFVPPPTDMSTGYDDSWDQPTILDLMKGTVIHHREHGFETPLPIDGWLFAPLPEAT